MVLKIGSTGDLVKILQELVKSKEIDGIFGNDTRNSVIYFQKRNQLHPDGIVGPLTWKKLGYLPEEEDIDTDRESYGNWIETYHLPEEEYIKKETSKKYIMLHHTAGRENPYKTIDHWAQDNRGRVGTNYVIGGISADGKNIEYDGKTLRAINDEYYGWHIGKGGSFYMKEHSLSIELCSAGGLKMEKDGWYTWYGEKVEENQVCILKKSFRGYKAFHKYSEEQIKSLHALLKYLSEKHAIDLKQGMQDLMNNGEDAFDWNIKIYNGEIKGLISHANVRRDKSDLFPQPELRQLINNL